MRKCPDVVSSRNTASETKTGNVLPRCPAHVRKAVSLQCHGDQPTPPRIFPYKWHWCLTQDLNSTVSLERTLPQKESHFIVLDIKIKGDDSIIGSSYHQINTTETIISTLKQVIDNSKASQLLGSS